MKTTKNSAKLIQRLSRLKEITAVPVWMMTAVSGDPAAAIPADADKHHRDTYQEVGQVERMCARLQGLPPNWKLESTLL